MLTFFTIPKPFAGPIATTQRNTLKSWTLLAPDVEVIVFGDEEGTAEVCREYGLRHEAEIERSEFGTPLLSDAFRRAQELAPNDWLCYCNCDIVLTSDFIRAFARLKAWRDQFMMVGQRWDSDITEPIEFDAADWERRVLHHAAKHVKQRGPDWIDYFVFPRGLCTELPAFAVGRPCWDHWLIWWMRHNHISVVDTSRVVVAIHQNHDYSYHPEGMKGAREGPEFTRNRALVGSWRHLNTIADASHVLDATEIRRTHRHWGLQIERERIHWRNRVLVATGPLRRRLGLRKETLGGLFKAKP